MLQRSDDYEFDLSGGRLCLDFTNTVGARSAPHEHLRTYGDLLAWAVAAKALTRPAAGRLASRARRRPAAARAAVARARGLREVLYQVLTSAARRRPPRAEDLTALNRRLTRVMKRLRLEGLGRGFRLAPAVDGDDLLAMIDPVLRSAVDVLTTEADRVRVCADPTCAWLFIDTTRNHGRRWCDMTVCGNRNKVRRFRALHN